MPSRDPKYWGASFWFCMHTVAEFFPDHPNADAMAHAKNFFLSLQGLLPCPSCAAHYAELLARYPIDGALHSREHLMAWVHAMHNEVNRRIGKQILPRESYMASVVSDTAPAVPLSVVVVSALAALLVVGLLRLSRARVEL
jgi:FAD-linked sulfhydryl oxidase